MRYTHAPQACITDRRSTSRTKGVHHVPKERITQKSPICLVDKSDFFVGDPYGTRTHVTAVKGRCLNHLTNGPGSGNLTRTDDTPGMNRMLYQLSYAAISCRAKQHGDYI